MATSKKTHTTKKAVVTKRPTSKKAVKKVKARPLTWRFYAVTIGIYAVAVTAVVVLGFLTAYTITKTTHNQRLSQIQQVYDNLKLGDAYIVRSTDIFAEKRTYTWDATRSEASSVTYVYGDTVANTIADLDAKMKAAGFTSIETERVTSKGMQLQYKSADDTYVRIAVSSKPYQDALENASIMSQSPQAEILQSMDKNAGPSHIVIKVNLDDNNE